MQNLNTFEEHNESVSSFFKAAVGATRKVFGTIGQKFKEITKSYSDNFKNIKSAEELKENTIKVLNQLSNDTISKINSAKDIKEIKPKLDEFEAAIKKIMQDFDTVKESKINENFLLGAKALFKVVGDYWGEFKNKYEKNLEILKKEADVKKRLIEAKKLTVDFIKETIKNSVMKIKQLKVSSMKSTQGSKAQAQSQKGKAQDEPKVSSSQVQSQKGKAQEEIGAKSTSEEKVKSKYKDLLGQWRAKQKEDGKKNLSPGEGTRKRLKKQAEDLVGESNVMRTFESFIYKHY